MALTLLAPIVAPGPWGIHGVAWTLTALDNTNGNQFASTGHEVLVIYNSDSTPHTITVTSAPDTEGVSTSLTQACAATTYYIAQLFPQFGWSVGGYIILPSGQNALLQVAVLQFTF